MRAADAARVADLTTQLGYPVAAGEIGRRFAHLESTGSDVVLVAVDEGDEAVAWIHVGRFPSLEASEMALIGGLVVDERQRSAGIGAGLVAAAEEWAREHGAGTLLVRSRSTRERAHQFYLRLGYSEVKRSHVFEKPL